MPRQKLYAGAKIRETRLRVNLTQKEFAAKTGVSLSYLNQMENNHRFMTYDALSLTIPPIK